MGFSPASGLGLKPGHGATRTAAGRFIPSTGVKWGIQDGLFPAHLARLSDITS